MMEREGDEQYRVSMRDTFILYDTLVHGIELPEPVVNAINRKTEQYYISEEYKFRVEREKRESERKKIEAEGIPPIPADRHPRHLGFLPELARHRGDAAARASQQFEGGDHRQRQGRIAGDLRQFECAAGAKKRRPRRQQHGWRSIADCRRGNAGR